MLSLGFHQQVSEEASESEEAASALLWEVKRVKRGSLLWLCPEDGGSKATLGASKGLGRPP